MADKSAKWEQNINGEYYVDDQCIACDACCVEAPDFFFMNDDDGHAYVAKQPKTESEKEECENALEACPVAAIGNDGLKD
ncbi:MAG: ferredoxin [Bacteriovoracaceae bacterium]|jgi:ferredoxin|nr:ferredoxin [Bacteriovoracaceae bacterium]|tara:strand:+ start:1185 stop:1424 length:240 start_codon:yes stop_codon:yes gene_type:complete